MMTKKITRFGFSLFTMVACVALHAQSSTPSGSTPSSGLAPNIHMTHTSRAPAMVSMHGMHTMPVTVTSADAKTGVVDVIANGMALRVHFPPDSMKQLKVGDKIGLYMAFSQPTVVP